MGKDEPATLPRVARLVVISRLSPWCTIITRETGVTIADVCSTIYKEYVPQPPISHRIIVFTSAELFFLFLSNLGIQSTTSQKLNSIN